MGDKILADLVAVAIAIVSLATLAALVSKKASTSDVIGAATKGFATDIQAALAPVS